MFSPSELQHRLHSQLALPPGAAVCVALSGGLDSTVLLHAMARLRGEPFSYRVRAAHIDHGLHADSSQWRFHCEQLAQGLQIDLVTLKVRVERIDAVGLEAAARDARYRALSEVLQPGEYLLSAHHADDQLETTLLALMRGAGVPGLSAMPALQSFAQGWLARPLLGFTRAELETWGRAEALSWVSDPSNDNVALDRNFLRHEIIARLRERWPSAAHTATRSAEHLQAAGRLLERMAALDASEAINGECLDVRRLQALDSDRRQNVLRHWIVLRGARMPSTRKLQSIEHDMLAASADRNPRATWDGWEIRRHRHWLYCAAQQLPLDLNQELRWAVASSLALPAQLGELRLMPAGAGGLSAEKLGDVVDVRFRAGGESLQLSAAGPHHKLKKLLQASSILPWWRPRLPLIYSHGRLAAVGDLWIEAEFAASSDQPAVAIVWQGRPAIEALVADQSTN